MATNGKTLEIQKAQKQEMTRSEIDQADGGRIFVPRVDIYETNDDIVMIADMPGVDEQSVDITLEKNVLTINGRVEPEQPDNFSLAYAEYETGDFQRSFTLTSKIDWDQVEATVQDGVLHLRLPKAPEAKAKKITVKAA